MFLIDTLSYVYVFFAAVAFLYAILIEFENEKVIPRAVYNNKNAEFYGWWKIFSVAAFLLVGGGFVLITLYKNNTGQERWFYLGLGIFGVAVGLVIIFLINRKAIKLFDPEYYSRLNGPENQKKKKEDKKEKDE